VPGTPPLLFEERHHSKGRSPPLHSFPHGGVTEFHLISLFCSRTPFPLNFPFSVLNLTMAVFPPKRRVSLLLSFPILPLLQLFFFLALFFFFFNASLVQDKGLEGFLFYFSVGLRPPLFHFFDFPPGSGEHPAPSTGPKSTRPFPHHLRNLQNSRHFPSSRTSVDGR